MDNDYSITLHMENLLKQQSKLQTKKKTLEKKVAMVCFQLNDCINDSDTQSCFKQNHNNNRLLTNKEKNYFKKCRKRNKQNQFIKNIVVEIQGDPTNSVSTNSNKTNEDNGQQVDKMNESDAQDGMMATQSEAANNNCTIDAALATANSLPDASRSEKEIILRNKHNNLQKFLNIANEQLETVTKQINCIQNDMKKSYENEETGQSVAETLQNLSQSLPVQNSQINNEKISQNDVDMPNQVQLPKSVQINKNTGQNIIANKNQNIQEIVIKIPNDSNSDTIISEFLNHMASKGIFDPAFQIKCNSINNQPHSMCDKPGPMNIQSGPICNQRDPKCNQLGPMYNQLHPVFNQLGPMRNQRGRAHPYTRGQPNFAARGRGNYKGQQVYCPTYSGNWRGRIKQYFPPIRGYRSRGGGLVVRNSGKSHFCPCFCDMGPKAIVTHLDMELVDSNTNPVRENVNKESNENKTEKIDINGSNKGGRIVRRPCRGTSHDCPCNCNGPRVIVTHPDKNLVDSNANPVKENFEKETKENKTDKMDTDKNKPSNDVTICNQPSFQDKTCGSTNTNDTGMCQNKTHEQQNKEKSKKLENTNRKNNAKKIPLQKKQTSDQTLSSDKQKTSKKNAKQNGQNRTQQKPGNNIGQKYKRHEICFAANGGPFWPLGPMYGPPYNCNRSMGGDPPPCYPYYRPYNNYPTNSGIFQGIKIASQIVPNRPKENTRKQQNNTASSAIDQAKTGEDISNKQKTIEIITIHDDHNSACVEKPEENNCSNNNADTSVKKCQSNTQDKETIECNASEDLTNIDNLLDKQGFVLIESTTSQNTAGNNQVTNSVAHEKRAMTAIVHYDDDNSRNITNTLLSNLTNIERSINLVSVSLEKPKEILDEKNVKKESLEENNDPDVNIKEKSVLSNNDSTESVVKQEDNSEQIDEDLDKTITLDTLFNDDENELKIKLEKEEPLHNQQNDEQANNNILKKCTSNLNYATSVKMEPNIQGTDLTGPYCVDFDDIQNIPTSSPKQTLFDFESDDENVNQSKTDENPLKNLNIIDDGFLNTIQNNSSLNLKNTEINATVPTNHSKLTNPQNTKINQIAKVVDLNSTNYNIVPMEIDDDDDQNNSDKPTENNNSISVSESDSDSDEVHNIESDIVEIIDIIKTNPTDFETLLDVITNSSESVDPDNMLLNDITTAIGDILKNSSSHSIKASMSKERVVGKMSKREHRKRHLKTQHSIQKLFHQLRETSQNESQLNSRNSLINSQNSSQTSIIDLDDTNLTMIPNELRNNLQTDNSILILDDEQKACSTPKRVSLQKPPRQSTKTLDDIILAQSNNNNNKSLSETRIINRSSFQTIDLTTDSGLNKTVRGEPTVIDISDTCDDVTLVSAASSMSGDSEVTVLRQPISRKLRKFTSGIANLNADEKGKLLELITQTIFNGCDVQNSSKSGVPNLQKSLPRAAETAEDTYIKEVILGTKASRSSVGSNIYHPDRQRGNQTGPRMIVIDGSNVAMEHGRGKCFSVHGLQICINYFLRRGHVVKAFVPRFRCKFGKSSNPRLLDFLERKGLVIYTPSREVQGRTITPYDDRYIIQCAAEFDAVVVSGDNFRDLINENPRWRTVIENRILPFTWVDDMIMFPRDPLGRDGPSLEQFLRHPNKKPGDFMRIK